MKKFIYIILFLFLFTGCSNISEDVTNEVLSKNVKSNNFRKTYNYYLPDGFIILKNDEYNEIFKSFNDKYYLYVDVISYFNKESIKYKINDNALISKKLNHKNKKGYIEVIEEDSLVYIQILYNYAKIEVTTNKDNVDRVVTNSLIILSNLKYKKNVIDKTINSSDFDQAEIPFDILEKKDNYSNFLDYLEDYGTYEEEIPDLDLIN